MAWRPPNLLKRRWIFVAGAILLAIAVMVALSPPSTAAATTRCEKALTKARATVASAGPLDQIPSTGEAIFPLLKKAERRTLLTCDPRSFKVSSHGGYFQVGDHYFFDDADPEHIDRAGLDNFFMKMMTFLGAYKKQPFPAALAAGGNLDLQALPSAPGALPFKCWFFGYVSDCRVFRNDGAAYEGAYGTLVEVPAKYIPVADMLGRESESAQNYDSEASKQSNNAWSVFLSGFQCSGPAGIVTNPKRQCQESHEIADVIDQDLLDQRKTYHGQIEFIARSFVDVKKVPNGDLFLQALLAAATAKNPDQCDHDDCGVFRLAATEFGESIAYCRQRSRLKLALPEARCTPVAEKTNDHWNLAVLNAYLLFSGDPTGVESGGCVLNGVPLNPNSAAQVASAVAAGFMPRALTVGAATGGRFSLTEKYRNYPIPDRFGIPYRWGELTIFVTLTPSGDNTVVDVKAELLASPDRIVSEDRAIPVDADAMQKFSHYLIDTVSSNLDRTFKISARNGSCTLESIM